ncbi:MAG: helix-turn-helix transcriptional regulator [Dermatophilaceae bacterium]
MWEHHADRARRDIAALAASGLGVSEMHRAAIGLVDRHVGTDLTCWACIDPESLVISTMTGGQTGIPAQFEPLLAHAEYSAAEPHTFAGLARHNHGLAKLSELSQRDRERCARLTTVWRPLGLDRELRVLFRVDGACWGAAGMVRAGADFSERECEFLAAVAPAVAAATRLAVRTEVGRHLTAGPPAVVVVRPDGALGALTAAAREWQERLDEIAPGRFLLMMQVMAAGVLAATTDTFHARLRDGRGSWAVLQASRLIGPDEEQVAVVIEPATGDRLLGMLLEAYALTQREREVCRQVIAGRSTADIAGRLVISANTVQDHLKSVFAKVGVRSRGELVARLRPEGAATDSAGAPTGARQGAS